MEIHKDETSGAFLLMFPKSENRVVLSLLKALYTVSRLTFIREAIEDLERDLIPRLTLVSHFHYCEKCVQEIDDKVGDNFIHITTPTKDIYVHRNCPLLKEDRP